MVQAFYQYTLVHFEIRYILFMSQITGLLGAGLGLQVNNGKLAIKPGVELYYWS